MTAPGLVSAKGSPRERGLLQGRDGKDRVSHMVAALAALPLAARPIPKPLLRGALSAIGESYLTLHRGLLRRHRRGRYLEALEGLACGLGVRPGTVYGFNAFEIESANLSFRLGCTALAIPSALSRAGRPWLAYNHDFPPSFAPFLLVRRGTGPDVRQSLTLTYPMLVGAVAGVNDAGLAMTVNQAFATDLSRARPALLSTLLLQTCLDECASVGEAVAVLRRTPCATGALFTLVDAAGERAVAEVSATHVAVRREPEDRVLSAFNKYRLPELVAVEVPVGAVTTGLGAGYDVHSVNVEREARWPEIEPHAALDREGIRRLLADHGREGPSMNTICCHGDAMNWTIASAIIDPVARTLDVGRGPACEEHASSHALEGAAA